jgi:Uma2 family endonuclease
MTDVLQPSSAPGSSDPPAEPARPPQAAANGSASEWPDGIPTHMTFEEYLAWDYEGIRAEWVDGEVVLVSPVRLEHQFILGFLYELVMAYVRRPTWWSRSSRRRVRSGTELRSSWSTRLAASLSIG